MIQFLKTEMILNIKLAVIKIKNSQYLFLMLEKTNKKLRKNGDFYTSPIFSSNVCIIVFIYNKNISAIFEVPIFNFCQAKFIKLVNYFLVRNS